MRYVQTLWLCPHYLAKGYRLVALQLMPTTAVTTAGLMKSLDIFMLHLTQYCQLLIHSPNQKEGLFSLFTPVQSDHCLNTQLVKTTPSKQPIQNFMPNRCCFLEECHHRMGNLFEIRTLCHLAQRIPARRFFKNYYTVFPKKKEATDFLEDTV